MTARGMRFRVERFDPARHDRASFDSGVAAVDNFLKLTANKLAKADNLRVFVMTDETSALVGYYAINAATLSYEMLPQKFARTRPAHGLIPAAYLSMMGIDRRHAGRGLGRGLLANALQRILALSDDLGMAVAVLDVLDCGNPSLVSKRRTFYETFGFQPIEPGSLKLFLPIATIRASLSKTSSA